MFHASRASERPGLRGLWPTRTFGKFLAKRFFDDKSPGRGKCESPRIYWFRWWAWVDLNHRPRPYQYCGRCLPHLAISTAVKSHRSGISTFRRGLRKCPKVGRAPFKFFFSFHEVSVIMIPCTRHTQSYSHLVSTWPER